MNKQKEKQNKKEWDKEIDLRKLQLYKKEKKNGRKRNFKKSKIWERWV